jgi:hypothetical protein
VEVFYRLGSKEGKLGRERYVRDLVDVVRKEKVELWVNCEGGNADGEVKEVLERETRCKVLQFGSEVMKLLEDEDAFGKRLKNLGLNILEQHRITSEEEALAILYPERAEPGPGKQYIIKSASPADLTSSEMALLPLSSQDDTKASIKALSPSRSRPLILQEFIPDHQHYTTQAHIINSKPGAFVAYPTSTTLLTPLPSSSLLSQILLKYTTLLTSSLSSSTSNTKQITGHLNLLFSLPSPLALSAESRFGAPSSTSASFLSNIHLISCTPTLSLGTLAFRDASEDLASAYLSILPDHEPKGIANGHKEERIVVPRPGVRGYYSFGNEAVRLVLLPIWGLLRWQVGVRELLRWWIEFLEYVVGWRECWWEVWDPWVVWWRYGGYVVGKGLIGLWERRWGTEDE